MILIGNVLGVSVLLSVSVVFSPPPTVVTRTHAGGGVADTLVWGLYVRKRRVGATAVSFVFGLGCLNVFE